MEVNKYGKLCLNKNKEMFVIQNSLLRHPKMSDDYENNSKLMFKEMCKKKCRSDIKHQFSLKTFIYDPLIVFSKPIGNINLMITFG